MTGLRQVTSIKLVQRQQNLKDGMNDLPLIQQRADALLIGLETLY